MSTQGKAYFAGGCFWCMEEAFEKVEGVSSATSGYMGGTVANPSYEAVSAGRTGHAESVEVVYDPAKVSYQKLLDAFWLNVDPITPNAQFCDHGNQYRSAIFFQTDEEKRASDDLQTGDRAIETIHRTDRHADCDGLAVLSSRGIPSGLLQEEPYPLQILQIQLRSSPAAGRRYGGNHNVGLSLHCSNEFPRLIPFLRKNPRDKPPALSVYFLTPSNLCRYLCPVRCGP